MAKRYSPCMSCNPRRKLSMLPAPGRRMRRSRRSRNWTSFSSPWARAWDGHEVVDLAVGRLARLSTGQVASVGLVLATAVDRLGSTPPEALGGAEARGREGVELLVQREVAVLFGPVG